MKRGAIYKYVCVLILSFISVFVIDFLSNKYVFFHFGKDNGLLFRIISLIVFTTILFFQSKQTIAVFFASVVIGFLSYFVLALLIFCLSYIIQGNHKLMNFPLLYYQLICMFIINVLALFFLRKSIRVKTMGTETL
jgi:hypothetical protein